MLTNLYDGGSRLNEGGATPNVDLRFAVTARRFPSSYGQWALGIPDGLPRGFGEALFPGDMINGWKYFLGLGPWENDTARWPRLEGSGYLFILDPKVTDVFWRIRYTPTLSAPSGSWLAAEPGDPEVLYNPLTGEVEFPLPAWDTGFFRLEIGLR